MKNTSRANNQVGLEILHVTSKKVSCSGIKDTNSNTSGHPLVYLNMGENDFVVCPYCSKYFTINKNKR
jgi:uncharacterized Zn-finger protein